MMCCSVCTLKSNSYVTDVIPDANLEEDVDEIVLPEEAIVAAEDGEDAHHELADVLALVPPHSWRVMV